MRKKLIEILFNTSQKLYTKAFKKHEPWGISKSDLLNHPKNTFGYNLGVFLDKNGFDLIAKVERHDAYHVLTGFGTNVEDEIALQYLCLGNGKRSPYMFGAIFLGTVILPDYLKYYLKAFNIGKNANSFHQFDYKKLLKVDYIDFKKFIFTNHQLKQLTILQHA